jgi:hypothetical protein
MSRNSNQIFERFCPQRFERVAKVFVEKLLMAPFQIGG